jgi:hypothetical protein
MSAVGQHFGRLGFLMTETVYEVAKKFSENYRGGLVGVELLQYSGGSSLLNRAVESWLKDNRPDDGVVITAEWLAGVGFKSVETVNAVEYSRESIWYYFWRDGTPFDVKVGDVNCRARTRGGLRRMCRLLDIDLRRD